MKNDEILAKFTEYCKQHPEQRFWQALRNFSGADYILYKLLGENAEDTFYWNDLKE